MRLQRRRGLLQPQQQRGGARSGHRPMEEQHRRVRQGRGAETVGATAAATGASSAETLTTDSLAGETLTSAEENDGKIRLHFPLHSQIYGQ